MVHAHLSEHEKLYLRKDLKEMDMWSFSDEVVLLSSIES